MKKNFTKEQLLAARHTDLYTFLVKNHDSAFTHEKNSIRLKHNHSISIRKGYHGYKDFATNETGNSVTFLVSYMGYGLAEAVHALIAGSSITAPAQAAAPQQDAIQHVPPEFPAPVDGRYKNLFAYLMGRGISAETIQSLVSQKLIYQEKSRNNIVFINPEKNFAEIRGTYTYGKPFHGVVPHCRHDGFWWFRTSKTARKAYICEAAVDAISLYELHRLQEQRENAYYISIAGAAKQPAIDRLADSPLTTIIAVDNDDAGQKCRDRNASLSFILPVNKDRNEDLQALRKNNA